MIHNATISAVIKIWHHSLSVAEIEEMFELNSVESHNVNTKRLRGDNSAYESTYVCLPIVDKGLTNFDRVENVLLNFFDRYHDNFLEIQKKVGNVDVCISLHDNDFISIVFSPKLLSKISTVKSTLTIENYS